MTARRSLTLVVSVALAAAALLARVRRPGPLTDEEKAASPPLSSTSEEEPAALAPPTPADVRIALARAFSGCVVCPAPSPESAIADFNGDGSPDVVVVVEPSEERSHEINDDLRNWIVQDLGRKPATVGRVRPARVEKGERLLAVIHGHGPAGWRSPEARQAYLLKNAAGVKLGFVRKEERAGATLKGPPLGGDVIAEEIDQTPRYLYWTGAGYAWR
jgi:hypothetical protein